MAGFREALAETIGREAADAVLRGIPVPLPCPAGSARDLEKTVEFGCYGAACASVRSVYGEAGAQRILRRAGRAAFSGLLRSTAALTGADRGGCIAGSAALAARMQPVVRLIALLSDVECDCVDSGGSVRFRISACPECAGRTADRCLCDGMAGMVEAAVGRPGEGAPATVAETGCLARGDPYCEFIIDGGA